MKSACDDKGILPAGPFSATIQTGARMHFGLICGTRESGWRFGGIGLMLSQPGWHIRASISATNGHQIESSGIDDAIIRRVRQAWTSICDLVSPLPDAQRFLSNIRLQILESPPLHCGFGAGTQLTLGIAGVVELLWKVCSSPNEFLWREEMDSKTSAGRYSTARRFGRAERSVVGTEGFENGGFIVDYGCNDSPLNQGDHTQQTVSPRNLKRLRIPDEWRFVIARPEQGRGISGEKEQAFFRQRQTMSVQEVRRLSEIIEQRIVPSIEQQDAPAFARSIGAYGKIAGQFYAPAQGDIFSDPVMNSLVNWLERHNIHGAAQSSWGPGVCIPAGSETEASEIRDAVDAFSRENPDIMPVNITITSPMNHGAVLQTAAPADRSGVIA
ncbi:MAG: hypothetical protein KDA91_04925 [Planctomycetaceae bacterium]|nr:hypothetical protein [Planctomycetaceae bacterium]